MSLEIRKRALCARPSHHYLAAVLPCFAIARRRQVAICLPGANSTVFILFTPYFPKVWSSLEISMEPSNTEIRFPFLSYRAWKGRL